MPFQVSVTPNSSPSTLGIPAGSSSRSYPPDSDSVTQSTAEMRLPATDSEEMVLEPKINQEEEEYYSAKTSHREVLFYRQKAEEHRSKMRVIVMSRPLDVWREIIEELTKPDPKFGAYAWKYTLNWTGEILTFQLGQVDDMTFRGIWHDLTPLELTGGSDGCVPNAPKEKGMKWRCS